jgi:hypothetical protein
MKAIMLLAAIQAASAAPPQPVRPYDCSWTYHPPTGSRERLEGVYTSFIDAGGLYECSSDAACRRWIGLKKVQIAFSKAASAELSRRGIANYGVFRVVFEVRRGKLGHRSGCGTNEWSLEPWSSDYVLVEEVVRIQPLKEGPRYSRPPTARVRASTGPGTSPPSDHEKCIQPAPLTPGLHAGSATWPYRPADQS